MTYIRPGVSLIANSPYMFHIPGLRALAQDVDGSLKERKGSTFGGCILLVGPVGVIGQKSVFATDVASDEQTRGSAILTTRVQNGTSRRTVCICVELEGGRTPYGSL